MRSIAQPLTLQRGDLLHCLHCHRWHPLTGGDAGSTLQHIREMLYFTCKKGTYYGGSVGGTARYPTKSVDDVEKGGR